MSGLYTASGAPLEVSRYKSGIIRAEFLLIESAFNGVWASPAFTGVPTAPTAAAGTSTTQLATCEFVSATAFSSALPGQSGAANKFLYSDGSAASWKFAPPSQTKTANYTAAAGENILADTSAGAWTLTLPASPSVDDYVSIVDVAGSFRSYSLTIGRNGQKIMGLAEDMTCRTDHVAIRLTYTGSTYGWKVK